MSPTHRRYLLLEQGLGAGVVNFVLNAAIAWATFRGADAVPLWGQQSIAGDTLGTCLLLPLLTTLIVTRLARGQIAAGRFPGLAWTRASHPFLGWLPARTGWRGLVLGLGGVVLFAPPTLLALRALGVSEMAFGDFVLFKAGFAAVAGVAVTPLVALWAIAEAPAGGRGVRRGSAA
jgi:hypothetical protein